MQATKKAPERKVDVMRVNRPVFERALRAGEIISDDAVLDENSDLKSLARRLEDSYKKLPDVKMLSCDNCFGASPKSMTACPYCGEGEDEPEVVIDLTVSESDLPSDDMARRLKTQPVPLTLVETYKPIPPAEQTLVKVKPKPKSEPPVYEGEILPPAEAETALSLSDLDRSVQTIQRLKMDGVRTTWQLGRELAIIHEKQLYKLRTSNGKPIYRGFDQFCAAELGFTAQNALKLIDTSKWFSEEQLTAYGPTKLGFLLQVSPEVQKEILRDKIEAGASSREVLAAVKAARAENPQARRDTGRKEMPVPPPGKGRRALNAAPPPEVEPKHDVVTVAAVEGVRTIPLFEEGSKNRATKLSHKPRGTMMLDNETEMLFRVVMEESGLVLKVITKRKD